MTTVYLVRHSDVENPRSVLYGHLDGFPLSEVGRRRAQALADRLSDSGISRIISSPLARAVETANIIAGRLPSPVEVETDPELREAEFSRYLQGVRYWMVPLLRPRWYLHKLRRGMVAGDEAITDLGGRILAVARRAVAQTPDRQIVLVSHADPLQAAWILLDGRPHNEAEMYRKAVDRAGLLKVLFDGDRALSWEYQPPPRPEPVRTPS
ncbi:MAG TPA: histidine phosphatase family protein [Candidatus Dormibacteraeota bacterium]|nr:histidine phosphatase family protein [Candidatus Dormibacteraeota bacterium]